ncbi:MAG: peptide chain release factor 2 [Bacilli bacterium]
MREIFELKNKLEELNEIIRQLHDSLDLDNKKKRVIELEKLAESPDFWNDRNSAVAITSELDSLKYKDKNYNSLVLSYKELEDLSDSLDINDKEMTELCDDELTSLEEKVTEFRKEILFSGEYDELNAILEIHPGAGGTESHDWADILYRMYTRFAERHNFSVQVLDEQRGEEAGINSVTLLIKGKNVYGMLKGEKGVHRLVRISPFDSGGRRHTSFASVGITPQFTNDIDIKINDTDIKVDCFRAGGAGGQNVNKVSSAVRITHLPTGIVVSCQVERSQLFNKDMCMQMLKARLYERELKAKNDKLKNIIGEQKTIEWGSQIRSYVFCPYTLVKDNRTDYEMVDVNEVVDGDLDGFIFAYLEKEARDNENI